MVIPRHVFVFKPSRLPAVAEQLKQRLGPGRAALLEQRLDPTAVDQLLQRISRIPDAQLPGLAAELLTREIWMLVLALPRQEDLDLVKRCAEIIRLRWRLAFGSRAWQQANNHPGHPGPLALLRYALEKGQRSWFPGSADRLPIIERALASPDLVPALGAALAQGEEPYVEQARACGVAPESQLWLAVRRACLLKGEPQAYLREDPSEMAEWLAELREEELVTFADRYLQALTHDQYQQAVMSHLFQRLGMPVRDSRLNPRWEKVSVSSRSAFQKWWNARELSVFFNTDNERHRFWLQYVGQMREVYPAPYVEALIMVFSRIVVVEFAHKGNAAYLYLPRVFLRVFNSYSQAAQVLRPSRLKLRGFRRDRIIHSGSWQWRAKRLLSKYLAEGDGDGATLLR